MIGIRGVVLGAGVESGAAARKWVYNLGGVTRSWGMSELAIRTDWTYQLAESAEGLLIHDGRAPEWREDPLAWNGSFLALAPGSAGWRIWTDRLGTIPLFWARIDGGTIVSSRLADLLEFQDFVPDPIGILQAVMLNHPLGQRTVLASASLASPASVLEVAPDGVRENGRYWKPTVQLEDPTADQLEQGMTALQAASDRALAGCAGPMAWPVTGGADSRCCLALNRHRLGDDDTFFHVAELGRTELPLARAVARRLGRELELYDPSASIRSCAEADVRGEAGELHVGQWFLEPAAGELRRKFGCEHVVDGYLLDSLLKPSMIRQGTANEVREQLLRWARFRLQRFHMADDRRARDLLDATAAEYPTAGNGMAASQRYALENRSRRMVFGHARLQGNHLDVRTPGLDTELIDFAMALPWSSRKNGSLYRRIIGALAPDLARIPHDRTGLPLTSDKSDSKQARLRSRARYYVNRLLPGPDRFVGRESRFERYLRSDAEFRREIYTSVRRSEWLAEAIGGDPVAALERQRRTGRILSDCLGNMLHVALLERYAYLHRSPAHV